MKSSNPLFRLSVVGVVLIFGWCVPSQAQQTQQGSTDSQASSTVQTATVPIPTAQTPEAAEGEAAKAPAPIVVPLGVGTTFNATLQTDLDARRNQAGDTFNAVITEPVRYQRSVIFPKDTVLIGRLVRATAAGHGRRGSGLFLQFERAVLKSGEEAVLNAGLQAVAASPANDAVKDLPEGEEAASNFDAVEDVSTVRDVEPVREKATRAVETARTRASRSEAADLSKLDTPITQGSFTKQGLFTPDSQGVFGLPDVKLYTPLSQGSDGTVLLSTRKDLRLAAGTKLLVVIQPPATAVAPGAAAENSSN